MVYVLTFALVHFAPGDTAVIMAGERASKEYVESLRMTYGLDKPIYEQFIWSFVRFIQGDLGFSYVQSRSVLSVILEKLPATLYLVLLSQALAGSMGTLLGLQAARKYGSWIDTALIVVSLTLYSIPGFWTGIILIQIFAVNLHLFPVSNIMSTGGGSIPDVLWHTVLPVLASTSWYLPFYLCLGRGSVLEVMNEDFVNTFRSIGESERRVFLKHVLRNALLPTVTMWSLWLGWALTGTILIETVFAWPGMSRLMYDSILSRDYPMLMGIFVVSSIFVVIANLVSDIAYGFLDPRVVYR